jgi:hypothetical protein
MSHGWDDGIEAEGANENVRIWGNYIDKTAIGIATDGHLGRARRTCSATSGTARRCTPRSPPSD